MELTKERLEEMAAVDIRTVDISTLTDLRDIEIDTSLPCLLYTSIGLNGQIFEVSKELYETYYKGQRLSLIHIY